MRPEGRLTVALVEDDAPTRAGLQLLIDRAAGFACLGAFASAEDLLRNLDRVKADVFLVDVHLPGMSGPELVPLLRERAPGAAVVMLTAYGSDDTVFESICGGAHGYLLKTTTPTRLLEGIREVCAGGSPVSPEIARKVLDAFRRVPRRALAPADLTPHEVRLLRLLAEGYSYEGAALELDVSINTVRSYIRSSYEKLQVHSKSAAVVQALRRGLL